MIGRGRIRDKYLSDTLTGTSENPHATDDKQASLIIILLRYLPLKNFETVRLHGHCADAKMHEAIILVATSRTFSIAG